MRKKDHQKKTSTTEAKLLFGVVFAADLGAADLGVSMLKCADDSARSLRMLEGALERSHSGCCVGSGSTCLYLPPTRTTAGRDKPTRKKFGFFKLSIKEKLDTVARTLSSTVASLSLFSLFVCFF